MTRAARERAAQNARRRWLILFAAVVLVVVGILVNIKPLTHFQDASARLDKATASVDTLKQQKAALQSQLARLSETGYLETLARQQMTYVRPGEDLYIVTGASGGATGRRRHDAALHPRSRPGAWAPACRGRPTCRGPVGHPGGDRRHGPERRPERRPSRSREARLLRKGHLGHPRSLLDAHARRTRQIRPAPRGPSGGRTAAFYPAERAEQRACRGALARSRVGTEGLSGGWQRGRGPHGRRPGSTRAGEGDPVGRAGKQRRSPVLALVVLVAIAVIIALAGVAARDGGLNGSAGRSGAFKLLPITTTTTS